MPAYWAPPPGIMNTTDGASPRLRWAADERERELLQRVGRLGDRLGDDGAPDAERLAPDQPGEGDVGQVDVGVGPQVGGQVGDGAGAARRRSWPTP